MKKLTSLLLVIAISVFMVACGSQNREDRNETSGSPTEAKTTEEESAVTENQSTDESEVATEPESQVEETENKQVSDTVNSSTLVVYFSATGNTKAIAEDIAEGLQADIYEIVPEEPYTDADLDYNDDNSRSTLEMNDSSARPGISGTIDNFEQYTTIYLGYPIWWGEAPRIMDTFIESYDFTDKTVIPFCTSIGSGIGSSANTLASLAGSGDWMNGQSFGESEDADTVIEWARQYQN